MAVMDSKTCLRISSALRMGVGLSGSGVGYADGAVSVPFLLMVSYQSAAEYGDRYAPVEMTAFLDLQTSRRAGLAAGQEGRVGIECGAEGETDGGEKGLQAGQDGGVGGGGVEEREFCLGREGSVAGEAGDAEATVGAVGAGGEIGDAEDVGGCEQDGSGRGHAVDHGEDLEFGLELVGDEVNGEISRTDSIFYGSDEVQGVAAICKVRLLKFVSDAAKIGGKDVFQSYAEASCEKVAGEAASGEPGADDGDVFQPDAGSL